MATTLNAGHPAGLTHGSGLPPLFFFTDEHRTPDPLRVIARLPEACGVIFRHYEVKGRAALAGDIVRACARQNRMVLIAGDAELARDTGADGLHLPAHMVRILSELPDARLVTAAAHDAAELDRAQALGADAAFLSPVFATASHPNARTLGPARFKTLVAETRLPVYALGGVTDETAGQLAGSGAVGLAAIDGLL